MARNDWEYVPIKRGLMDFINTYLTTEEAYKMGFKHKGSVVEELIRNWQKEYTGNTKISIIKKDLSVKRKFK